MTSLPRPPFTVTVEAGPGTAHLRLEGDLDYDTSGELVQRTDRCLAEHPDLRQLHLDCAELRLCDSMGVSTFLMIHRLATAREVRLHLDNPPPFLERILGITGIRTLFTTNREVPQAEETQAESGTPPTSPLFNATPPQGPGR
ncbi:STAS domain-containing protein [Streptomyces sp. NBC_00344]|uniref:STAS domain-containing protein n=1 Tax=Streptomyces sp. NBC_00344 TaxID=2975720 RepID=UPI002E21E5A1